MYSVFVDAPLKSRSGYGYHARDILLSLIRLGKYNIFTTICSWGSTPNDAEIPEDIQPFMDRHPTEQPDLYIKIGLPDELKPCAKLLNILITAGVETTLVSHKWVEAINNTADMVIVPSNFTKQVFQHTQYEVTDQNGRKQGFLRVAKPFEVIFEGVDTTIFNNTSKAPSKILDGINTPFNFLFVGHWLPGNFGNDRKNVGRLVKDFLEVFRGNTQVSLILKTTGTIGDSIMGVQEVRDKIEFIRNNFNLPINDTPAVHIISGNMTNQEMADMYSDNRIKMFVSPSCGEGFNRPLMEAMACDLPTIQTGWSGHMDFTDTSFDLGIIRYDLRKVPKDIQWGDVIIDGGMYANPNDDDFKVKMLMSYSNHDMHKEHAVKWGNTIRNQWNFERMQEFLDFVITKHINIKLGTGPKIITANLPSLDSI